MDFSEKAAVFLPAVITACGAFFLIKLKAFFFVHPIKTVKTMFSDRSQLRQLSLALAGTLGVGSIVGVAVAVSLGGAGAVFWMWISALVAAVLKYAEIVLAVKYREYGSDGQIHGGPMYYMKSGVGGRSGRALAAVFAALGASMAFIMGNLVQARAAVGAMEAIFDVPPLAVGVLLAALCAVSLFGGFDAVSRVTSAVVPLMSAGYIAVSLWIILSHIGGVPRVVNEIFSSAFDFSAAGGGAFGFLLGGAVRHGVLKGAYSHEAGGGTSPLSHAQTKIKSPGREGLLGLFEVFFDTIIICTLTAFVILLGGESSGGVDAVKSAFGRFCGDAGVFAVMISIVFFAFSTMICWGYYGTACLEYLTKSRRVKNIYLALYCAVAVLGSVVGEGRAWALTDAGVALMTYVNLVAVVLLWRDVKSETELLGFSRRKAKVVPRGEGRRK